MKYFLDEEFIEGFRKPCFGKRQHFIELISIGIVREDGAAYYAISSEYDYREAGQWVNDNVIQPMYIQTVHGDERNRLDCSNFHKHYGKNKKQIAGEIKEFIADFIIGCSVDEDAVNYRIKKYPPEFYGYYSDYDWVLFCSLYGTMMELPDGFPMYCIDLKQTLDETAAFKFPQYKDYPETRVKHFKSLAGYPVQKDEHNALSDALFNFELYKFLQTF